MSRHLFLVAGESSGDQLGAHLMRGLLSIDKNIRFSGVGGSEMSAMGLTSLFDYEELSVNGITEVLPRLPQLLRCIKRTANAALTSGANGLVTIDSPDFSFRLAARIRQRRPNFRIVHYVSPSVWAWRAGRVKKIYQRVDHVMTLLPFEPDILRDAGISATFVGHPVAQREAAQCEETQLIRQSCQLSPNRPVLLMLPGSRKSEIQRLGPVFANVVRQFLVEFPHYQVILPAADPVRDWVQEEAKKWPFDGQIFIPNPALKLPQDRQKWALFSTADLALAASGTVTLELAAAQTPTVSAYDVQFLSRLIISTLLRIPSVTLPNIISGQAIIPELLGKNCQPSLILEALRQLCLDKAAQRRQIATFSDIMQQLQEPKGDSPAHVVMRQLGERSLSK